MSEKPSRIREIFSWIALNALWVPIAFQDAALLTIAVPAEMLKLAPNNYVLMTSYIGSAAAFASMLVPPFAGWLSDRLRRTGGRRRVFVALGLALNVAALVALSTAHSLAGFVGFYLVSVVGSNVAQAAYQAMLPELIPRAQWGAVSGVRGALTLVGTIVGLGTAAWAPAPSTTFLVAGAIVVVCAVSLLLVHEGAWSEPDRAHVSDWHDFFVVFAARALVFFGLYLLQNYVLFYFRDVLHLENAPAGTAAAGFCTMLGALGSAVYLGILSDRAPRKVVTAIAGVPMALAAIGFAIAPAPQWMLLYAFLFGIGFGGVFSTGWALAMDSIPAMRDVARDLGLWGIATNLPTVVAPLIGGSLITAFHGTRAGYQAVFGLAGFSFALASLCVLRVGRRPLSSMWAIPARLAAVVNQYAWTRIAYRVRNFGDLPWRRGPTLLLVNHQHDIESQAIVSTTSAHSGPWRHPVFTACSRRMYEPGFLAMRLPWARSVLRKVNAGPLFMALGLLPIENELGAREICALAFTVESRHGALPLSEVFEERVSGIFPPGTKTSQLLEPEFFERSRTIVKLATLREPYRREVLDETRAHIKEDRARFEDVLKRGGTFYVTPEGHYSKDGRMGPMLGIVDWLAPFATIYIAGVSYDPFVSKRFSMLYTVRRLDDRTDVRGAMAAARPVVTTQLLATFLNGRTAPFTAEEACAAVEAELARVPAGLFVDPELRTKLRGLVHAALARLTQLGILRPEPGGRYVLAPERRDPQFPQVDDIVAYMAAMYAETVENARYSAAMSVP